MCCSTTRESTKANYLGIWRSFNNFIIRLDYKPKFWEDRVALYAAYLINTGIQSATLKSYISGIKHILKYIGYKWSDQQAELSSLTKACRIRNDVPWMRLPIHLCLLELLLFEISRMYDQQPYLKCLYHTIFLLAYYGLFRIGELVQGKHQIKAKDFHLGVNKKKILVVLHSSKTHGKESRLQQVKITSNDQSNCASRRKLFFCPFISAGKYLTLRGNYFDNSDPFFIFRDNTTVQPWHVCKVLNKTLQMINLNHTLYGTQSFRIGRASDMMKHGASIEQIKQAGCWKSNAVYKYIKNI